MPSEFKTTPFMMYHPSSENDVMHYTNFNSSTWYLLRDAANTPAQNQKYDYTEYANWNSNPDKITFYIMRPFADLVYDFLNSKADQFAFVSNKFNIWDRFYDKEIFKNITYDRRT